MKFGRLLASGKSLVNGNVAGRYQMRKGMALPQFISPKNPFKQEAAARPVAPPPVAAAPANVSACEFGTSPSQAVNSAESERASGSLSVSSATGSAPVASDTKRKSLWKLQFARPVIDAANLLRAKSGTGLSAKVGAKLGASIKWSGAALQRAALFCLDHNPFSAIGKPKLAGIPRFGKAAEQPELSLERVQVVRNDLTHADLEVVQMSGGSK